MIKYVINLERSSDRWEYYKENKEYIRWNATDYKELNDDEVIFNKMISYYNINPIEHKAKCACFLSHIRLWKHIIDNDLKDVLILEDDADEILNYDIQEELLPKDAFTYFGGYFYNIKMTDGEYKDIINYKSGINKIDKTKFRILMNMAYYIPNKTVASIMYNHIMKLKRYRAIDTLMYHIPCDQYYILPAKYIERNILSTIRKKKKKHPNELYRLT